MNDDMEVQWSPTVDLIQDSVPVDRHQPSINESEDSPEASLETENHPSDQLGPSRTAETIPTGDPLENHASSSDSESDGDSTIQEPRYSERRQQQNMRFKNLSVLHDYEIAFRH